MRTRSINLLIGMAVTGFCISPATGLRADDRSGPGIAHISDAPNADVGSAPGGQSSIDAQPGAEGTVIRGQAPLEGAVGPPVYDAGYEPSLYADPGSGWFPSHQPCTHSPDHGWSRPVKRPVLNRIPVQYHRFWPARWYGEPGAFSPIPQFPMVYMPTDTTQLGYTYQRVPTWMPNPAMIPPPPWPAAWHRRECPPGAGPFGAPTVMIDAPVSDAAGFASPPHDSRVVPLDEPEEE